MIVYHMCDLHRLFIIQFMFDSNDVGEVKWDWIYGFVSITAIHDDN